MNKLEQLVPDLFKKQRKAAFLTVLLSSMLRFWGSGLRDAGGWLAIMKQNLVLYVTI